MLIVYQLYIYTRVATILRAVLKLLSQQIPTWTRTTHTSPICPLDPVVPFLLVLSPGTAGLHSFWTFFVGPKTMTP